jgi:hypothetical protein
MRRQRPNILWYCTDQQRLDTIGAARSAVAVSWTTVPDRVECLPLVRRAAIMGP